MADRLAALPGAVALVVDRDGKRFEAVAGRRDLSAEPAMTADTVYWLASLTKPVLSVAVMQLVERESLSLDAPIGRTVPALVAPLVLEGFDVAGRPKLRPARTAMTLRHLLTHTAGYGYHLWNPELGRCLDQTGLPSIPVSPDEVARTPLLFDLGTGMAGLAVEAASGQSLDTYLRAHVLSARACAGSARHARHLLFADAGAAGAAGADAPARGGGLCGTAGDYGRFLRMLLNGGALEGVRLLRAETVAAMGRTRSAIWRRTGWFRQCRGFPTTPGCAPAPGRNGGSASC
jgi:CubicO group peptidase (beta-lactamase class C family)